MTSRERWTVYPLLFLAIGLAMRPGEESELEIQTEVLSSSIVRCREILVESDDGTVLLHMGRVVGGGGRIEVKDASGGNTVAIGTRPDEALGRIEFFDSEGRLRAVLDGLDEE